jgi:hypothetical protein
MVHEHQQGWPMKEKYSQGETWVLFFRTVRKSDAKRVFARFPVTRDVPWAKFLFFAVGGMLSFLGLKHAFGQPQQYRGKIAGSIQGSLSLLALGFFCFIVF